MKVYIGGITPEAETLVKKYIDKYAPDAEVRSVLPSGILSTIRHNILSPDTLFAIMEDSLYNKGANAFKSAFLSNDRIHNYTNEDDLHQFLIRLFGRLDSGVETSSDYQDSIIINNDAFGRNEEKIDEYLKIIAELQEKLAQSELVIQSLNQNADSPNSDVSDFIAKIKSLEEKIKSKDKEIEDIKTESSIALGKLSKADDLIDEVDSLTNEIRSLKELVAEKEHDKLVLETKLKDSADKYNLISSELDTLSSIKEEYNTLQSKYGILSEECNQLKKEVADKGVLQDMLSESADVGDKLSKANDLISQKDLEIKNLKVDLDSLVDTYNKLQSELSSLKDELLAKNEALASKEKELLSFKNTILDLENSITDYNNKVSDLISKTDSLNLELESKNNYIIELERKNESASNDSSFTINSLRGTISELESSLQEANNNISSLRLELDTKSSTIVALNSDINSMSEELDARASKIEQYKTDLNESLNSIDLLRTELSSTKSELDSTLVNFDSSSSQIQSLSSEVSRYQSELDQLRGILNEKTEELDTIKTSLSDSESSLGSLINERNSLQAERDSLFNDKEDLLTKLSIKEGEVEAYKTVEIQYKDSIERIRQEKESLEIDLEAKSGTISGLETMVSEFKSRIESDSVALEESNSSVKKLENEVSYLRDQLITAKSDSDTVSRLNNELLEERRRNARLNSEVEILRNTGSSIGGGSREEVEQLRKELDDAKSQIQHLSDNSEVFSLRRSIADKEMEIAQTSERLYELENGIFGKLANSALPRIAFDLKLNVPQRLNRSRFVCLAAGSAESLQDMYAELKKTCTKNSSTKYLIVDLVSDTYIDMAFGISKLLSPIKWLSGSEPFTNFTADTKCSNVRVISTGLAYINDLAMLTTDWERRLSELDGYADVVVLSIGCLNNLSSRIMYSSFTQIMDGNIVVKATPINIRTLYLLLTGYKTLTNTLVSCVKFDTDNSKLLYQKLLEKCQGQILKPTDIIRL